MYGWHVLRSRLAYELAGMLCVSVLQMEIGTRRVFQNTQDCVSAAAKQLQLLSVPALLTEQSCITRTREHYSHRHLSSCCGLEHSLVERRSTSRSRQGAVLLDCLPCLVAAVCAWLSLSCRSLDHQ